MALRAFTSSSRITRSARSGTRARSIVVRASEKQLGSPIVLPSGAELTPVSLGDAFKFSGPGPETANGRLAMVGVVAAVISELATGRSVLAQANAAPLEVLVTLVFISAGTLAPIVHGSNLSEAFGPLTPEAEKFNGRVAMMGIAALIAIEAVKGSALL